MEVECLTASGRRSLLQRLTAMVDKNLQGIALELVPAEFRGHFQRSLATKRFCPGFDGEVCIFALAAGGGRAQIQRAQAAACFFCNPEAVAAKVDALGGRHEVAGLLKQLSPTAKAKALAERIPEDARADILNALQQGAAARRPPPPASAHELQERWAAALGQRQRPNAPATATEKKIYREQVLADRARGRKHAGRAPERAARGVDHKRGAVPRRCAEPSAPARQLWLSAWLAGLAGSCRLFRCWLAT